MTRKIELNSIKLPLDFWKFKDAIEQNAVLKELTICIRAYVKKPSQIIQLNGYLAEHGKQKMNSRNYVGLTANKERFAGTFTIVDDKINLPIIYRELEATMKANSLEETFFVEVRGAKLLIDKEYYYFRHHAPAKALTLKEKNGKGIGKLSQEEAEKMLSERFSFCRASKCYKVYEAKWQCE